MDRCLFIFWEDLYGIDVSHRKSRVHVHFFRRGLPLKKVPIRIYGIDVSHYLGLSTRKKMHMDRCLFFFWEDLYGIDASHRKTRVHVHFFSERSTPKKVPIRIYWIDVSNYLGLSTPEEKCTWTAVYFFLGRHLWDRCIP